MMFIPGQLEETNRDCSILANGSQFCYYSNGTRIISPEDNNIGGETFIAFTILLRIILVYVIAYLGYKLYKAIMPGGVWHNNFKRMFRRYKK